jgi:hypothetical protein
MNAITTLTKNHIEKKSFSKDSSWSTSKQQVRYNCRNNHVHIAFLADPVYKAKLNCEQYERTIETLMSK